MKILVFSDSHGCTGKMLEVINQCEDLEMIIHLGDLVKDAKELKNINSRIPIEYIAGNNDWRSMAPREKVITIGNKKGLITHGDLYGVKNGYSRLGDRGWELGVDFVLFGHTHVPYENYYNNILLINPGSITLPAAGLRPTYCVLQISAKEIDAKIESV